MLPLRVRDLCAPDRWVSYVDRDGMDEIAVTIAMGFDSRRRRRALELEGDNGSSNSKSLLGRNDVVARPSISLWDCGFLLGPVRTLTSLFFFARKSF